MDFWSGLQIYLVVAVALAGTSYWNLYKPAIELLKEILDDEVPRYSGWLGTILWLLISFTMAPITALMLLTNDNNEFIQRSSKDKKIRKSKEYYLKLSLERKA